MSIVERLKELPDEAILLVCHCTSMGARSDVFFANGHELKELTTLKSKIEQIRFYTDDHVEPDGYCVQCLIAEILNNKETQ